LQIVKLNRSRRAPLPTPIEVVREMLDRWPTRATLAHDLQLSYWTVSSWLRRGWVPLEWHAPVLKSARRYGIHTATLKSLDSLPEAQRRLEEEKRRTTPTIKGRRRAAQGTPLSTSAQSRAA